MSVRWLAVVIALCCLCAIAPAQAALRVAADLPAAGVLRDDLVVALRGLQGSGEWLELKADDPLGFQWNWLRCTALRRCRVQIERGGEPMDLPLWTDDVELLPELPPELLALLSSDNQDSELDAALEREAVLLDESGLAGQATWLRFRRIQRALELGDLDAVREMKAHAINASQETAPLHALQLQLELALLLSGQGHAELAMQQLEALALQPLPMEMQVRTARVRAGIAYNQSRLAQAESILRGVEELARRKAPDSHLLASTLNSLAVVIRPQGRLQEARVLFDEALRAAAAFASDSVLEAMIRANLGLLERAAGDLVAAERVLRQALESATRMRYREDLVFDTQSNLALVLLDRGRTREAAAIWNQQIPAGDAASAQERAGRAQHNLALVYAQQGNLQEAVRRLRQAVAHWQIATPGGLNEANARLDLGWYAARIGEFEEAEQVLRLALEQHQTIAPGGSGVIGAYDALAAAALQKGAYEEALEAQVKAIALRDAGEQPNWRRDVALTQLARIQLALKRHTDALAALAEATGLSQAAGREAMLATALAIKGEVLLAIGQVRAARTAACTGIEHIEQLRGTSPSGAELRSGFVLTAAPIYRSCLDALLAADDVAAALDLYQSERRLMLSALIADRDLRFADLPADLLADRRSALVDLQQVARELESASDAAAQRVLKERREQMRQRLRRLDARVIDTLPRLASWQVQPVAAPTRAAAGQRVLAYAVRESDTLLFVLTPEQAPQVRILPLGHRQLADAIGAWRGAVTGRMVAREQELARQLHQWLIEPGAVGDAADALVIVPDGPLHGLPFAALIDGQQQRLVQAHTIRLSALVPEARQWTPAESSGGIDLLAMADTGANGDDARPGLPGAEAELALLEQLPWERMALLRGTEASPAALHSLGPQARRLHFAVHGVNDPQSPLDSALLLRDSNGHSSPLAVWDIFETLRLDAELVVLAACDTAPGASVLDDGWLGLTRAFQFAGAEQVVSALWPVDDGGTASLMGEFHRQLAAGIEPALALALSQRRMLEGELDADGERTRGVGGLVGSDSARSPDSGQPYYWAGFHLYLAPR